MPDSSGAVDLTSPPETREPTEEQETGLLEGKSEDPGPQPGPEPQKEVMDFAFVVVGDPEGNISVLNYEGGDFLVERRPTPDMVYGAASVVLKDLAAQETSRATVQMQMMQAQAIAQQQQEAAIRAGLHLPGQG